MVQQHVHITTPTDKLSRAGLDLISEFAGKPAFPVSKYARYKRTTAFFLEWLLHARGCGRHAAQRVKIEEFNDVVLEITAEPATLTPKLLQEPPKALAACQCAITLREHVATFFVEDGTAQRRDAAAESERLENYYNVLVVDEDDFPDEEILVVVRGAPRSSKADRKRLFDEAFAEDLRLKVVYFFLELEGLVEGVFTIYDQVNTRWWRPRSWRNWRWTLSKL
ncbi:hypothetical protein KRP22_005458 [Phytophthora ramorum]|nr:hypothetical protein KRP22_3410 [Phytophthora ramorum]